jgi:cytochrome c
MRSWRSGVFAAIITLASGAHAIAQDVEAGQKSFNKCRACHQIGETAKNGIGPQLNGLFSRMSGTAPNYAFSEANKNAAIKWDEAAFDNYIRDPRVAIPGTKMVFAGIKNDTEIKDLTAFLKQYGPDGKKL